jgi:acetoin utilization deacetylase AcuC-like enzyme
MRTGFVWDERYGFHDTGTSAMFLPASNLVQHHQHVESAESKVRFAQLVRASGLDRHLVWIDPQKASEDQLLRVHTEEHVSRIKSESESPKGGDAGDGVSPFGPGGYEIARLAAGGTIAALDAVLDGSVDNAYALVRPPGHHAVPEHGMGFCIFSNIGVAIADARAREKLGRVAVVDYDVHHGNGTQAIFYDDADTLAISLHQDGLFPQDSGTLKERGDAGAEGTTVNIPLPAGSGNGAYEGTVRRVVVPMLERFRPEIIIVASGFDASVNDPLGRMMVTSTGYATMTRLLLDAAERLCEGRLLMSHEGGYSPVYVPYCGVAVLQEMCGSPVKIEDPFEPFWSPLPGQELMEHQSRYIDRAAAAAGLA